MSDDDTPAVADGMQDVIEQVQDLDREDPVLSMQRENAILGDATELVADWSAAGDLSESRMRAFADALSDQFCHYTKTDVCAEFDDVFVDATGRGVPFDELIDTRLESLTAVHTTDAKQGVVWRWEFSDGVQLETEATADGTRKHFAWKQWREDYFESLIAVGEPEQIAAPANGRADPEEWRDWLRQLIAREAETIEHVGPRTEAVEQLRDWVHRQAAYADLEDMQAREGCWLDSPPEDVPVVNGDDVATDGGEPTELRVPTSTIQRIVDQAGISMRALQIELEARGLVAGDGGGVAGESYEDGRRVAYWSLSPDFATPEEWIAEPITPAEQLRREEAERIEEERTAVGAVERDDDRADSDTDGPPPAADSGAGPPPDDPGPDGSTDDDDDLGVTDGFGGGGDE